MAARIFRIAVKSLAVIFIVRWLGPSEFGLFTLALSTVALVAVFVDLGISPGTARLLAEGEHGTTEVLRTSTVVLTCSLVIGSLILVAYGDAFLALINAEELQGLILVLVGLLWARVAVYYAKKLFEGLRRVDLSSRVSLAIDWAPWAFALLGVGVLQASAAVGLVGKLLGTCLLIAGLGIAAGRLLSGRSSEGRPIGPRLLFRYSLPMMLTATSFYVYAHADILIIQAFLGEAEVGIYGTAVRLLDVLHVPAAAIGSAAAAFFVRTRERDPDELPDLFRKVTRGILTLYIPLTAGLLLTARPLLPFLFGQDYSAAGVVAIIYGPFLLMKSLAGTYSMALDYLGHAGERAIAVGVSAAANIILNILLVPRYGIVAAAMATQVTYVPLVAWYVHRLIRISRASYASVWADLRPVVGATLLMAAGIGLVLFVLEWHVLVVIGLGIALYAVASWTNGAITARDVRFLVRSISSN